MKLFRGDLKVPLFFDMNFSKNVLSLLSDSLENYPDIFLVDFKVFLIALSNFSTCSKIFIKFRQGRSPGVFSTPPEAQNTSEISQQLD